MYIYQVNIEQEEIYKLIESNGIDIQILKSHTQKMNVLAVSHLYLSSKQTIPYSDFVFEMMTDGLTKEMGLPIFVLEEVSTTNGRIYFDQQVFKLVKYICKVYDNKKLAKLLYFQPVDNLMFDLIIKGSIEYYELRKDIAFRLATEICKFSIKILPNTMNISNLIN